MKITFLTGLLVIIMVSLTACDDNDFLDVHTSYYRNFTAAGEGNGYEISGTAEIVNADTLGLVYISAIEATDVDLSGKLRAMSGDAQIIYINADNKETVLYDSSDNAQKENFKFNTSIKLDKGEGYLAFKGKDINFKFDLLFANIDNDKIDYFSSTSEKSEVSTEKNIENNDMDSSNNDDNSISSVDKENLLKEISVTYTNKDDNCSILYTTLDENTKIKVLIEAAVSSMDNNDSLTFDGFELLYKTQDDNVINVLNYEANAFSLRGYEWQDSFVQEIDLPKGTNELIYNSKKGTNYSIELNIQVLEAE